MRRYLITAVAALAAAGLTIGLTLATRTHVPKPPPAHAGLPPLSLELGVRTDAEAVALRRGASLYDAGKAETAAPIFARYSSLEARVGSAFAAWPHGFGALRSIAAGEPHSSFVQLNYGLALYWRGDNAGAQTAWREARKAQPDTPYSLRAEDLLHPRFPRGLPQFVPSFAPPAGIGRLTPPRQMALLRAGATTVRGKLLYGVALQRLGNQLSDEREFGQAAALAPSDPEPAVAVAVGRFDKADPALTFSQLGPLAKRFPHSQTVRFHLGLCLLWLGDVTQAKAELRQAQADGPHTLLGIESGKFLAGLAKVRTPKQTR